MSKKYICFVDIDGVLTSNRVHVAHNAYNAAMWQKFDPVAIDFFNFMHDTWSIEFCLMSTWKNFILIDDVMTEHWVRSSFANSGFRGILSTPWKTNPMNDKCFTSFNRPHEVKHYLETYSKDVDDFILFDDTRYDFDKVLGKKRLILTDSDNGLLFKHMMKAKSLMGPWEKCNDRS